MDEFGGGLWLFFGLLDRVAMRTLVVFIRLLKSLDRLDCDVGFSWKTTIGF